MKQLYRLKISGWWPVTVEEMAAGQLQDRQLQALYEDCDINPYDLEGLTLRLVRATPADIAKYGDTDDEEEDEEERV